MDRWQRRLRGLAHEYDRALRELRDEDEDSPRRGDLPRLRGADAPRGVRAADRRRAGLWREPRPWSDWLRTFEALAPRVLRQPARVMRVLTAMAPLGAIGPVALREVRDVLTPRLLTLTHEPPRRRHGHVFVGTPAAARGRSFRVVLVPGLAERVFPQRLREDALLLDAPPRELVDGLAVADTRADDERLQLCLAVGAATERIHLSYPRIELGESRPRVPSFYVLDVMRAVTGAIPRYATLGGAGGQRARLAGVAGAAPTRPAIDAFEHDLRRAAARAEGSPSQRPRAGRGTLQLNRRSGGRSPSGGRGGTAGGTRRRHHSRDAETPSRRSRRQRLGRPPLLAHGAAAILVVPVPVPAGRHLPAGAARGAGAAAAARPAHARQPVPRIQTEFLRELAEERPAAARRQAHRGAGLVEVGD